MPTSSDRPVFPIPSALVDLVLLGPMDDRRQLQDSPILGDVWLAYAAADRQVSFWWVFSHRDPLLGSGPLWFALVLLLYSVAFALSRLTQGTCGATPIGIFRDVERPVYDDLMAEQLAAARDKQEGDIAALLHAGDTWTI